MKTLRYRIRYYLHYRQNGKFDIYDALEDQLLVYSGGATLEEAVKERDKRQAEYDKELGIEPYKPLSSTVEYVTDTSL